jgi:hypothetical protein
MGRPLMAKRIHGYNFNSNTSIESKNMRNTKSKKNTQIPAKLNANGAKARPPLPSTKWLIHAATRGRLTRARYAITVEDLARARCRR